MVEIPQMESAQPESGLSESIAIETPAPEGAVLANPVSRRSGEVTPLNPQPSPPGAIMDVLGFEVMMMKDGRSRVDFEAGHLHTNPMGTLSGGVLCGITDAAMGMAIASTLSPGESFTTLELKSNFLRPFWKWHLKALGRTVHRGRTNVLLEAEVSDDQDRLIAKATSTCMILKGKQAEGR